MKRFVVGVIAGFGVAAVAFYRSNKNLKEINELLISNAKLEEHKKQSSILIQKNDDYRNRYPENT